MLTSAITHPIAKDMKSALGAEPGGRLYAKTPAAGRPRPLKSLLVAWLRANERRRNDRRSR